MAVLSAACGLEKLCPKAQLPASPSRQLVTYWEERQVYSMSLSISFSGRFLPKSILRGSLWSSARWQGCSIHHVKVRKPTLESVGQGRSAGWACLLPGLCAHFYSLIHLHGLPEAVVGKNPSSGGAGVALCAGA